MAGAGSAALLLSAGCASLPNPQADLAASAQSMPAQWAAPVPQEAAWPHEGRLSGLVDWWRQQSDPVVVAFIEAAQSVSPSISAAQARVAQARAEAAATGAALVPGVDLSGSALRRSATPPFPAGSVRQGALQASWELDVFGGQQAARDAAQWRLRQADAQWHDARVSIAADVALQVYAWRHCAASHGVLQGEAASQERSAALVRRMAEAGLQASSQADAAEAAAADARNRARQLATRCAASVKGLVMLTGLTEAAVRARLGDAPATVPLAAPRLTLALPAATLAQRPDVFVAASAVAAAAADVGAQQAQRYPRVGLTGSIGRTQSRSDAGVANFDTWSVGPLSISLPVFDAGRRAAGTDAAQARYADAVVQHRAVVRRAVREVEDALLQLGSTAEQAQDAQRVLAAAQQVLQATERRAGQGLASQLEVEDARRRTFAAEAGWLQLQYDRTAAWVGLYRAAGGGWQPAS